MGRELRRKQAKKDGKSLEKEEIIENNQIKKLLTTTCILVVILAVIYLLSAIFITKELNWFSQNDNTNNSNETVSNSILASAIFKQSEEEYYVYFYDFNEDQGLITELVNLSLSNETVYKVNTNSAMNANYVGTPSNKKAKNLNELKVTAPTLIKISNDTIVEYYENNEITNKLS